MGRRRASGGLRSESTGTAEKVKRRAAIAARLFWGGLCLKAVQRERNENLQTWDLPESDPVPRAAWITRLKRVPREEPGERSDKRFWESLCPVSDQILAEDRLTSERDGWGLKRWRTRSQRKASADSYGPERSSRSSRGDSAECRRSGGRRPCQRRGSRSSRPAGSG